MKSPQQLAVIINFQWKTRLVFSFLNSSLQLVNNSQNKHPHCQEKHWVEVSQKYYGRQTSAVFKSPLLQRRHVSWTWMQHLHTYISYFLRTQFGPEGIKTFDELILTYSQAAHGVQIPTLGPPQRPGSTSQERGSGLQLHPWSGLGPTTRQLSLMERFMSLEVRAKTLPTDFDLCWIRKHFKHIKMYSFVHFHLSVCLRYNIRPGGGGTLRPLQRHVGADVSCVEVRDQLHRFSLSGEALRDWLLCCEVQRVGHAVLQPSYR